MLHGARLFLSDKQVVNIGLQIVNFIAGFGIAGKPVTHVFYQPINLMVEVKSEVFDKFFYFEHVSVLCDSPLSENLNLLFICLDQVVCILGVLFELGDFGLYLVSKLHRLIDQVFEAALLLGKLAYLALVALDDQTHVVDLRLHVLGFVHWLLEAPCEARAFLLPELVDEPRPEAVSIDVVLEDDRHMKVAIGVSSSEVREEAFGD